MSVRIVLFGATGHTGGRTARALVDRGARPVLAGRDAARLAPLADQLGGDAGPLETVTADVTDGASVRALVGRGDVLVTTVGPFVRLGEPAVAAAVDAGAVYLDSTGEPPFLRRVFEEFGPRAARSGATLLTAFGHDYVPGTLAGALALAGAGNRAHRLDVGYTLDGVRGQAFSRGTLVSLIGVLLEPNHAFAGGRLVTEPAGARLWRFDVGGRPRRGLSVGGSEHLTLPPLAPSLREVGVFLDWFGPAAAVAHRLAPLTPWVARVPGARAALPRLADLVGRRVAEAPSTDGQVRTSVLAEVRDTAGELVSAVRLAGPDPYDLTADLLAWGATHAAERGVRGTGALGPVQAFGLEALTAGAAGAGITRA
ncbi:MAG: Saccharopine dehydrogenase [Modestobacter sp.]|nr:Saccharopine dehydrogenase [Modestobacter sp.]